MTYIVGLGHQSRVGKDTCGNYLGKYLKSSGFTCKVTSFAILLKQVTYILYGNEGIKYHDHYDRYPEERTKVIPSLGMSVVDLWIKVGQAIRTVHPDTWLNAVIKDTEAQVLIIRDVRFPNEAEAIRAKGGLLVKITRPGQVVRGSDAKIAEDYPWDIVINNDGELNEYLIQCAELGKKIKETLRGQE
jgi:hypothetical protein